MLEECSTFWNKVGVLATMFSSIVPCYILCFEKSRFFNPCALKYINLSNKVHVQNINRLRSYCFSDLSNFVPIPDIRSIYSQVKKVGPRTTFN